MSRCHRRSSPPSRGWALNPWNNGEAQPRGAFPKSIFVGSRLFGRRGVADASNRKEGPPFVEADRRAATPGRAAEGGRLVERGHRPAPRHNAADAGQALRPGPAGRKGPAIAVAPLHAVEGCAARENLGYEAAATPDGSCSSEPTRLVVAARHHAAAGFFCRKFVFMPKGLSLNFWGCTCAPSDPTSAPIGLPRDAGPSPNRRSARRRGLRAMTGAQPLVARWLCRIQEALSMIRFSDIPAHAAPLQEARP
jgi:hypothetical protein